MWCKSVFGLSVEKNGFTVTHLAVPGMHGCKQHTENTQQDTGRSDWFNQRVSYPHTHAPAHARAQVCPCGHRELVYVRETCFTYSNWFLLRINYTLLLFIFHIHTIYMYYTCFTSCHTNRELNWNVFFWGQKRSMWAFDGRYLRLAGGRGTGCCQVQDGRQTKTVRCSWWAQVIVRGLTRETSSRGTTSGAAPHSAHTVFFSEAIDRWPATMFPSKKKSTAITQPKATWVHLLSLRAFPLSEETPLCFILLLSENVFWNISDMNWTEHRRITNHSVVREI